MSAGDQAKAAEEQVKQGVMTYARQWGGKSSRHVAHSSHVQHIQYPISQLTHILESSFPPTLLATLITPLHARPFQPLPMLFPPLLLFTTYLNLNGYVNDAAGASAAWSGIYLLLANRRKQAFTTKFGARGLVRGAAMGVAAVNLIGGGLVYAMGSSKDTRRK